MNLVLNAIQSFTSFALSRDWQRLLKPAVVLAVLGLALQFGRRPSERSLILVTILVGGGLFLILLTRRLEIGIAGLIAVSIFGKIEVGTGTAVPLNLSLLLGGLLLGYWLLEMILIQQNLRLTQLRFNRAALIMLIMITVSLAAGYIRFIPRAITGAPTMAQVGGWAIYAISLGVFLLVAHRVRSIRWLEILTWTFIVFGGAYVVARLNGQWWPIRDLLFVSPGSFGSMFWTWLTALAFGQFLLNTRLDNRIRMLLLGLLLALAYVNLTQTRDWISGWLPPAVAVGVILWLRSWRLGLAAAILAGIVLLATQEELATQLFNPLEVYSMQSRDATWPIMLILIQASPVIGLGFGNYYFYTPLYPIMGWYVNFNSHNNYVDLLAQTGLVGLGLFVWFAAELGWSGWKARSRAPEGFQRAYVDACLGGLVAMLVAGRLGDWFLPFLYNVSFNGFRASILSWIFLGGLGLIANSLLLNDEQKEAAGFHLTEQ